MNLMKDSGAWYEKHQEKCRQIKRMMLALFAFSVLLYIVLIANQLTNHLDGLWTGIRQEAGNFQ